MCISSLVGLSSRQKSYALPRTVVVRPGVGRRRSPAYEVQYVPRVGQLLVQRVPRARTAPRTPPLRPRHRTRTPRVVPVVLVRVVAPVVRPPLAPGTNARPSSPVHVVHTRLHSCVGTPLGTPRVGEVPAKRILDPGARVDVPPRRRGPRPASVRGWRRASHRGGRSLGRGGRRGRGRGWRSVRPHRVDVRRQWVDTCAVGRPRRRSRGGPRG